MTRISSLTTLILSTISLTNCGPGLLAPGPPLPGLGPGLEWITLLIVVIGAAMVLRRSNPVQFWRKNGRESSKAYEILRERYAKGEVSREDYLRAVNDLDLHDRVHGA